MRSTAPPTEAVATALVAATAEGLGLRRATQRVGVGRTTVQRWMRAGRHALAAGHRDRPEARFIEAIDQARGCAAIDSAFRALHPSGDR